MRTPSGPLGLWCVYLYIPTYVTAQTNSLDKTARIPGRVRRVVSLDVANVGKSIDQLRFGTKLARVNNTLLTPRCFAVAARAQCLHRMCYTIDAAPNPNTPKTAKYPRGLLPLRRPRSVPVIKRSTSATSPQIPPNRKRWASPTSSPFLLGICRQFHSFLSANISPVIFW